MSVVLWLVIAAVLGVIALNYVHVRWFYRPSRAYISELLSRALIGNASHRELDRFISMPMRRDAVLERVREEFGKLYGSTAFERPQTLASQWSWTPAAWQSIEAMIKSIQPEQERAAVSDEWIRDEVDSLYRCCRFVPEAEPFLLDPGLWDSVGDHRDRVLFLLRRHGLEHADIAVYVRSGLKHGSRLCAGLAQYPVTFNTSGLTRHQTLLSVSRDGAHTVLDSSDPERPIIRSRSAPVPVSPIRPAIFLDRAFLDRKGLLGGIIAHEVAHLYLYSRGVNGPTLPVTDLIDEHRTDVAMFVMGLGLVALRAAAPAWAICHTARCCSRKSGSWR